MDKKAKHTFLFYTPAICWGILICYFSLLPSFKIPNTLASIQDFILHFLIYGALGMLAYFGSNKFTRAKISSRTLGQIVLACFLLGFIIELLQEYFAQGRHFELSDIAFNSLGILLALLLHQFMRTAKL